jgi:hypothetical protein
MPKSSQSGSKCQQRFIQLLGNDDFVESELLENLPQGDVWVMASDTELGLRLVHDDVSLLQQTSSK